MFTGPVFVAHFQEGMIMADQIIHRDYGDRFKDPIQPQSPSRSLLDPARSFGSVIRMLTPADNYTDEYNAWLREIPRWIRKRLEAWGEDLDSIRAFGEDVVTALCERLLEQGAPCLHFYTLNKAEPSVAIWRNLGLTNG